MFPPRLRRGTRHPDAPSSPCFAAESVRGDTLRALPENTAHQPKHSAAKQHTKRRQPSPPRTQNTQPPSNTLNRDSLPPPQFARHGAHILNHHATQRTGGIPRTPEPQMRRGAYILCRDIRVSELCEDRSPAGAKRIICTSHDKTVFIQGTQKSRRFRRISGIFCEVRPLGLEPRTH